MGATLSSRAAPTAPRHFLADLNDGLHSAVRKNKFSQATSLLEEGADIYYRAPGPYGRSLLHQALVSQTVRRVRVIDSRRVPLVRLLCERGGLQLINALDNYGVPALRYAITSRCADLVRALLEGGASTKLGRGDTSLFRAVTLREPEIARLLLAHGADANQISRHGAYAFFQSPLVRAVVNNHVAMARILLDWGADIEMTASSAWSPINVVCSNVVRGDTTRIEMARLLLDRGADINRECPRPPWQMWSTSPQETALSMARGRGTPTRAVRRAPLFQLFDPAPKSAQARMLAHWVMRLRYAAGRRTDHPGSARYVIVSDRYLSRHIAEFLTVRDVAL
mmetsp:Transcript_9107/g.28388  ORF Transcript_9107/g.28388 Transcript_9107/m.28388 type:complete len:338 (+) Transcript_9107:118-1131(+)